MIENIAKDHSAFLIWVYNVFGFRNSLTRGDPRRPYGL